MLLILIEPVRPLSTQMDTAAFAPSRTPEAKAAKVDTATHNQATAQYSTKKIPVNGQKPKPKHGSGLNQVCFLGLD